MISHRGYVSKKVECSDYNQTILGKISDPILFYKVKSWCQNKSNCYFKAFNILLKTL